MQKNGIKTTILAIRPGRREMGIAILEGEELRLWGVTRFRERRLEDLLPAVERRLVRLIHIYQPVVLAVEMPTPQRLKTSPGLGVVTARISTVAVVSGLHFRICDPVSVRERLCGSAKATRGAIAGRIVEQYPHLARYRTCSSQWQTLYWMPMFAAVAVGLACEG